METKSEPKLIPKIEEVLEVALQILEFHSDVEISRLPEFSGPIEVATKCVRCQSTFITEVYSKGIFVCMECGTFRS